jgi:hypothetical protein
LTSLVKKIDQRMSNAAKWPRSLGAYVIFDNNTAGLDKQLRELAAKEGLKHVSLGIAAPPASYQVSGEAEVTVVVYNPDRRGRQNVKANFALRKGELDSAKADAIVKALADVLPR